MKHDISQKKLKGRRTNHFQLVIYMVTHLVTNLRPSHFFHNTSYPQTCLSWHPLDI